VIFANSLANMRGRAKSQFVSDQGRNHPPAGFRTNRGPGGITAIAICRSSM
jgi:hypothetical protein